MLRYMVCSMNYALLEKKRVYLEFSTSGGQMNLLSDPKVPQFIFPLKAKGNKAINGIALCTSFDFPKSVPSIHPRQS